MVKVDRNNYKTNVFLTLPYSLTTGINLKHNGRQNRVVPQYCKSLLFTQLIERVETQAGKLSMVNSSIGCRCCGYSECCVVVTQRDPTVIVGEDLSPVVVPGEGS